MVFQARASRGQVFPTAVLEQERGILNECFPSGWPGSSQQLAWCVKSPVDCSTFLLLVMHGSQLG